MKIYSKFIVFCIYIFLLGSCTSTELSSGNPEQRRQAILEMREEVLDELYRKDPATQSEINNAAGFGVFSDVRVNVGLAEIGRGMGIVKNNLTGQDVYMRREIRGAGLSIGKSTRNSVIVFRSEDALFDFVEYGELDISEKTENVEIYSIRGSGFALGIIAKEYHHNKDSQLN